MSDFAFLTNSAALTTVAVWFFSAFCTRQIWEHTRRFGTTKRSVLERVICCVLFFLAIWTTAIYLLWAVGVPLELTMIRKDRMSSLWQTALLNNALAIAFFELLRRNAIKRAGRE